MRIALAQINPTVGDIAGNARLIADAIARARNAAAHLVVFPELAIIGYPPKDLLWKPAVIADCVAAVERLAQSCTDIAAVIGYPCPSDDPKRGRPLYNAAALCYQSRILHRHIKSLLPTYDVFDEQRYFQPGPRLDIAHLHQINLGISICEDLWNDPELLGRQLYYDNPISRLARRGAHLFINCSASPFVLHKHDFRLKLFSRAAKRHRLPLLYCNQVGGNDELIFDGCSCAFDSTGRLIAQARAFQEDLLLVDLPEVPAPFLAAASFAPTVNRLESVPAGLASLFHALVLGLRDYCRKCSFSSVVLGLSGGIDSSLCAALAVAALGSENVHGIAMPSRFSSDHSLRDAEDLAQRLGIRFSVVPIHEPHAAFEKILAPHFAGLPPDVAEENIQARVRGIILMAFSNKFRSLLISTGNKSELAVGYCTLYGDMAGGLALISDVPKTTVWALACWINTSPHSPLLQHFGKPVIPENSITKIPSAELRPNQTDQDTLPPYDLLDRIIELYVERELSAPQIIQDLPDTDPQTILRVLRMIDLNEYKRKQAAPGLKVTSRAFGFGRRMPIAQHYDSTRNQTFST